MDLIKSELYYEYSCPVCKKEFVLGISSQARRLPESIYCSECYEKYEKELNEY